MIRKTSKPYWLAIARFGQPGSVWRSAGPLGVGASLTGGSTTTAAGPLPRRRRGALAQGLLLI